MNAKMADLKESFEAAGFTDVRTVIGTGNVVFKADTASIVSLQNQAERAMQNHLGRTFLTVVRSIAALESILASDPFAAFRLPAGAKRIVTFLRDQPRAKLSLPIELNGARILALEGREVFTAYLPQPRAAVFMALLEKTFGQAQTTRTWDTVRKVASALKPK